MSELEGLKQRNNQNIRKAVANLHKEEPTQEVQEEAPKPKTLYFRKEHGNDDK